MGAPAGGIGAVPGAALGATIFGLGYMGDKAFDPIVVPEHTLIDIRAAEARDAYIRRSVQYHRKDIVSAWNRFAKR